MSRLGLLTEPFVVAHTADHSGHTTASRKLPRSTANHTADTQICTKRTPFSHHHHSSLSASAAHRRRTAVLKAGGRSESAGDSSSGGKSRPIQATSSNSNSNSNSNSRSSLGPSFSTISAAGNAAAAAAAAVLTQSNGSSSSSNSSTSSSTSAPLSATPEAEGESEWVDDTWEPTVLARRIAIWGSLLFVVLQLKEFAGIFMGTLVLSVVGNVVVEWLERYLPGRRKVLVSAMYSVTVLILITVGVMRLPALYQDCVDFILQLQTTDLYSAVSNTLRQQIGDGPTEQLEGFLLVAVGKPESPSLVGIPTAQQRSQALQALIKRYSGQGLFLLASFVASTSRFLLQSAVSLILSFMVVWDLPTLSRSVSSLSTSRIAPFYNEIAPAVVTFGSIFRRALAAQSTIAVLNTGLTLLGMLVLRVSKVLALSSVVFLCSFVPVAGVIISTLPIGVVALLEGGPMKVVFVVLMVVLIHAIEAYILNPFIYSAHLKLHPILTLGVLVVSEHIFGVWGLVTAVPIAVFLVDYVIYRKRMSSEEGEGVETVPAH